MKALRPSIYIVSQANQLLRAEKRFRDFEEIVSQTNDQYQRQVLAYTSPFIYEPINCRHSCTVVSIYRDTIAVILLAGAFVDCRKAAGRQSCRSSSLGCAFAGGPRRVQYPAQLSADRDSGVCPCMLGPLFAVALSDQLIKWFQALHQRSHILAQELQVSSAHCFCCSTTVH
jgi:hypothetical protein